MMVLPLEPVPYLARHSSAQREKEYDIAGKYQLPFLTKTYMNTLNISDMSVNKGTTVLLGLHQ